MGVSRGETPVAGPPGQPAHRSRFTVAAVTAIGFVALLYAVELVDQLSGGRFDRDGIRPLTADGLWGIAVAPLLHAGWGHLLANTGPLLVLGFLVALTGLPRFIWATAIVWVVGGLGTWLIGDLGSSCGATDHIGASGLVFGWLTFLVLFGFLTRTVWQIVVGVAVLFGYGGILWGLLPSISMLRTCGGVSWQGHLCGALAGVLAAYLLAGPERGERRRRRIQQAVPG